MTTEELMPVAAALDALEARGMPVSRLRQIIADDALGCECCRREYGALVLRQADPSRSFAGVIELTDADFARTRAREPGLVHTCRRGACAGGACAR